jgi:cytochrome P450
MPASAKASAVPGPPLPRALQSWLAIVRPIEARFALRRRYGPLFRTNDVLAGEIVHVADRELVEQMFKWRPGQYVVGDARRMMEPVLGPASLLLLDGDRHLRMRRLMLPPFHGDAIAHYAALIEGIALREIARWRAGDTVRMRAVAQTITLEAIIRAVFGVTDDERVAQLKRLLPRLSSVSPFLAVESLRRDLGPRSPWGRFLRVRARADALLYDEIARRRRDGDGDGRRDVLSLLLAARDERGAPLSERELRDELVTLLLAGHETTANSIAWAFERLLRTPHALERASAEARAGAGHEYVNAVIDETLRVRPVVTEVFRQVAQPVELGGYRFEPGDLVAASLLLVQRDPALYTPDPHAFRPERFLAGAPDSYAWIPFGGGVRRCLGAAFAQLEMRVAIQTILARARLRAPRRAPERARFRGVTLLPARGGEAVVEGFA